MIIVGLQGCESCKILKQRYPDIEYVELPRMSISQGGGSSARIRKIKALLWKNSIDQFPTLLDEATDTFISMKTFDPEFAKEYYKLF